MLKDAPAAVEVDRFWQAHPVETRFFLGAWAMGEGGRGHEDGENMDIEYLLALQGLRQSAHPAVENIMLGFSFLCDGPLLVALALIIYWCIDKRMGQIAILCLAAGNFVSQLIKNIACVYRPWVLDERIVAAEGALEGAAGYSFPSGHSTGACATFGSIAWSVRKRHKVIAILCVLVILIVAFSRNFLGVHTPQDVVVGLAIALLMIVLVNMFMNWMERNDAMASGHGKDIAVLVVVLVVCAASVALVELKPYPMDYAGGQLLVDPETMKKGSFEAAGMLGGVALGWLFERRFVRFTTGAEVGTGERVARGIVGVALVGLTYVGTDILFKALLPYNWAKLCAYLVLTFVAVFVAPAVFKLVQRRFRPQPARKGAHAA